jgi:uncharacterized protein
VRRFFMFRITKSEGVFFEKFEEAAEKVLECANLLFDLMTNYTDIGAKIKRIECLESDCDSYVHQTIEYLNKSFITPIDREDIFLIAKETDDVVDSIEAIAHRFAMYNVTSLRPEAIEFAALIPQSVEKLKDLMYEMKKMKKSKKISEIIIEINRLENVGDKMYRENMTKLFSEEDNAIEVVKWKSIYELIEKVLDNCEDVANIVEGVVMKHA